MITVMVAPRRAPTIRDIIYEMILANDDAMIYSYLGMIARTVQAMLKPGLEARSWYRDFRRAQISDLHPGQAKTDAGTEQSLRDPSSGGMTPTMRHCLCCGWLKPHLEASDTSEAPGMCGSSWGLIGSAIFHDTPAARISS